MIMTSFFYNQNCRLRLDGLRNFMKYVRHHHLVAHKVTPQRPKNYFT